MRDMKERMEEAKAKSEEALQEHIRNRGNPYGLIRCSACCGNSQVTSLDRMGQKRICVCEECYAEAYEVYRNKYTTDDHMFTPGDVVQLAMEMGEKHIQIANLVKYGPMPNSLEVAKTW